MSVQEVPFVKFFVKKKTSRMVEFSERPSGLSPVFTALGQGKVVEDHSHKLEEAIKRLTPIAFRDPCEKVARALAEKVLTEAAFRGNPTPSLRAVEDRDFFLGHELEPAARDLPRDLFEQIGLKHDDKEAILDLASTLVVFFRALLAKKLSESEKMTPKAKGKILPRVCKDYGVSLKDILPKSETSARIPPSARTNTDIVIPPPSAPSRSLANSSSGLTKAPPESSASAPKSPSKAKAERERIAKELREKERAAAKERVKASPIAVEESEDLFGEEDDADASADADADVDIDEEEEEEDDSDEEIASNVVEDTDESDFEDDEDDDDDDEEDEDDLEVQMQALLKKARARAKPSKADKDKISQLENEITTLRRHLDLARAAKKVAEERHEECERAKKSAENRAVEAEQRLNRISKIVNE